MVETSHHRAKKTRFIRKAACQVFGLQDSEGIIEFHSKDKVWYVPQDGIVDFKKVEKFMEIADLELDGLIRSGTSLGLAFRILDAEEHGLASETRQV